MKQGDILIAINPCKMDGEERFVLTVGRRYEVQQVTSRGFCIIDNESDVHWFDFEGIHNWKKWFRLEIIEEEIY
jgi:hypothetical protein